MALDISDPMSGVGCTESKYSDADGEFPLGTVSAAVATKHARAIGIAKTAAHRFRDNMY
jgi:hypothetical protein